VVALPDGEEDGNGVSAAAVTAGAHGATSSGIENAETAVGGCDAC